MEKRGLPGELKAPRQATAEDALAHSVSWEPKQFPEYKKCAGRDQPTHPTVKYSLGTGENKWQQLCTAAPCETEQNGYSQGEGAGPRTLCPKTPQVVPFVVAFEERLVLPASMMPIPINSQLFQKVLQSTLKIVRHHLKGSVLIAALSED